MSGRAESIWPKNCFFTKWVQNRPFELSFYSAGAKFTPDRMEMVKKQSVPSEVQNEEKLLPAELNQSVLGKKRFLTKCVQTRPFDVKLCPRGAK